MSSPPSCDRPKHFGYLGSLVEVQTCILASRAHVVVAFTTCWGVEEDVNGRHVTSRASEKGCGAKERYRRRCEKFSKRRTKSVVVVVVDGDAV
jgi:hypothetical protein